MNKNVVSAVIENLLLEHNLPSSNLTIGMLPLLMSDAGWRKAMIDCPRNRGVYIHLTPDGLPLRVGIALGEEGIYGRWFHSRCCHLYAFRQKEDQQENYRQFFMQIQQKYSETLLLYVLMDSTRSRQLELILCKEWVPLWEVRDEFKNHLWRNGEHFKAHPIDLATTEHLRTAQVDNKWMRI
jgi:hypothetical protein